LKDKKEKRFEKTYNKNLAFVNLIIPFHVLPTIALRLGLADLEGKILLVLKIAFTRRSYKLPEANPMKPFFLC